MGGDMYLLSSGFPKKAISNEGPSYPKI